MLLFGDLLFQTVQLFLQEVILELEQFRTVLAGFLPWSRITAVLMNNFFHHFILTPNSIIILLNNIAIVHSLSLQRHVLSDLILLLTFQLLDLCELLAS
jgi:hypothetical protein